ncbi:MAG: hypothetical protein AAF281_00665 [Pseudomonadota bacterium]
MAQQNATRELRLHGGIHKTGSTYLQLCFARNRALLRARGLAVYGPSELRPVTARFFRRPRPDLTEEEQARFAKDLGKIVDFDASEATVLSQENMIGTIKFFVRRGKLYPTAPGVLRGLSAILPRPVTSIHLCLRDFPSYLASAYIEYIRTQPFLSFEDFVAKADLSALSWVPLVRTFGRVFKGAAMEVWDYEFFRRDPSAVIDGILGRPLAGDLDLGGLNQRPSASAAVIAEMARIAERAGPEAARDAMAALEKAHPPGPGVPRFDPWEAAEVTALRGLYRQDLETLDGLRWVRLRT